MPAVHSPLSGTLIALKDVGDPVLAEGIVGAGFAVTPIEERWHEVCAPADGRLLKVLKHAFIVFTNMGVGILVHMGIDTVKLHGEGFHTLLDEGDQVHVGQPVVKWDSSVALKAGLPTSVSVIACDLPATRLRPVAKIGHLISRGQPMFEIVTAKATRS